MRPHPFLLPAPVSFGDMKSILRVVPLALIATTPFSSAPRPSTFPANGAWPGCERPWPRRRSHQLEIHDTIRLPNTLPLAGKGEALTLKEWRLLTISRSHSSCNRRCIMSPRHGIRRKSKFPPEWTGKHVLLHLERVHWQNRVGERQANRQMQFAQARRMSSTSARCRPENTRSRCASTTASSM